MFDEDNTMEGLEIVTNNAPSDVDNFFVNIIYELKKSTAFNSFIQNTIGDFSPENEPEHIFQLVFSGSKSISINYIVSSSDIALDIYSGYENFDLTYFGISGEKQAVVLWLVTALTMLELEDPMALFRVMRESDLAIKQGSTTGLEQHSSNESVMIVEGNECTMTEAVISLLGV